MLARSWLQSHARASLGDESIGAIVVAAQPLGFGTTLTAENVVEIAWAARSLPEGAFASKEELLKYGTRAVLSALDRNVPVLKTKITGPGQRGSLSVILEEGKRAVTVRVDDVRGVAGFILAGDFVDVVLISEDPAFQREGYSDILLHHVKVLAISVCGGLALPLRRCLAVFRDGVRGAFTAAKTARFLKRPAFFFRHIPALALPGRDVSGCAVLASRAGARSAR